MASLRSKSLPGALRNGLVFLAILGLAALVRLYRLDDESLWYDEVVSVQVIDAPSFAGFLAEERALDPAIVPLYFFLEYQWWHHIASTEYGLRIMSVILGLATVAIVYGLGCSIFSLRAGEVAAICAAMAINQVYYAQEIRMYALTCLLAVVSIFCLERAIAGSGRNGWWTANTIVNGLLIWTHLFGTLVLVVQGLALVWVYRRRVRVPILWTASQSVYLLPLAWWVLGFPNDAIEEHLTWIAQPEPWKIADTLWTVLTGTEHDAVHGFLPRNAEGVWSHLLATLIWCCVMWSIWRAVPGEADPGQTDSEVRRRAVGALLLCLWAFVPVLLLIVLSSTVRPCYVERYVIHCGLPLFVLAGGGVAAIASSWIRCIAIVLLLAGFAVVTAQNPRPLRADLKSALDIIERHSNGSETVYLENQFEPGLAFKFYADMDDSRIVMGQDYHRRAVERVKDGKPAWLLLVGGAKGVRKFENVGTKSGLTYARYFLPGRRPIHLVHAHYERDETSVPRFEPKSTTQ